MLENKQNPLINASDLIKLCDARGIDISEEDLKYFQKRRLLLPVETPHRERLYSNFQVHWMRQLKEGLALEIELTDGIPTLSSKITYVDGRSRVGKCQLKDLTEFAVVLERMKRDRFFKEFFNLEIKTKQLRTQYAKFNKILQFLLAIEDAYYPYVRSGGGTIEVRGEDSGRWQEYRNKFNIKTALVQADMTIEEIGVWYVRFCRLAEEQLGVQRDDWLQLWKNANWTEKKELIGPVRLGIDYLQWSVMLQTVIEEYEKKRILDVDEVSNLVEKDLLKVDVEKVTSAMLSRTYRNQRYSDGSRSYYYDRFRRLHWLANDLGINYQPRVLMFVEGRTEYENLPWVFEKYIGSPPENLGIEFIDVGGVTNIMGKALNIKEIRTQAFLNNFKNLISYNLNKWQTIPFILADNENDLGTLLSQGVSISFEKIDYKFPADWQFLWGRDGKAPFQGKDFEFCNFSDEELALAIKQVLNVEIDTSDIEKVRLSGAGIKKIDAAITNTVKPAISKRLFENLFDSYAAKGQVIFERPIFSVMRDVAKLASLNHQPVDLKSERMNKDFLQSELSK